MAGTKNTGPAFAAGEIGLIQAYAGPKTFERTRWSSHHMRHWVIDVYLAGQQLQRVNNGGDFTRHAGVIALYAPGTWYHEYEPAGGRVEEAYVMFAALGGLGARLRRIAGPAGYCHIEDPGGVATDPLRRLGLAYRVGGRGSDLLVTGLTLEVLGLLESAMATGPQRHTLTGRSATGGHKLLARIESYLGAHLHERVRVADLARLCGMSESSFGHAYRRIAGQTPYQAILHNKVSAAKRLLIQEGLNVQQTAYRLGFSTPFNFSRTFKRVEGCSPRHYVERHVAPPG